MVIKFWVIIFVFLTACTLETGSITPPVPDQPEVAALSTLPVTRPVSTPTSTQISVETVNPTITLTSLPTQSATEGLEPHDPPTLPTHTPTPEYICPASGTAEVNIRNQSYISLLNSIQEYLNSGGNLEALIALLAEERVDAYTAEIDFNGDTINEVVMGVEFYVSEYDTDSATWIFQCRDGLYEAAFQIHWGYYHFREKVAEVIDLNNDTLPEVIIEHFWSGSACDYEITVVGWQSARGFVDYSPSHLELDFGCSGEITVDDLNGDNLQEIIIKGETVVHLSYAPPREIIQTFHLVGLTYRLLETEYLPTDIRVHIFDDAERALAAKDYLLAADLYDKAAHETSLLSFPSHRMGWVDGRTLDNPEEYQRAFALFRLAIIHFHLGNIPEVNEILDELDFTYPEGKLGGEFTVLSHAYIDARDNALSPAEACLEITEFIIENYPDLDAHIGDWGVNIASYNNDTICPVIE